MSGESKGKILKFTDNRKAVTVVYIVAAALFIAFFLYQLFRINYDPVKTEAALEKTVASSEVTNCFIVRDEYPITDSVTGTLVPLVDDGKRVASGDDVAVVFSGDDAARYYNEIKSLEKSIEYYSSLQNKVGGQTVDVNPINERIYSSCEKYILAVNSGDYDKLGSFENEIRDAITSRQLSVGTYIDPSVKLEELTTKLEQLKEKNIGYSTITAPHPGYYISLADGYESAVDYSSVESLTTQDISSLLSDAKKDDNYSSYLGKLVDGFNWYILCVINYDNAVKLREGKEVQIEFTMTTAEPIKATVVKIANPVDKKVAVILKSNLMSNDYARLRKEQVRITFDEFTGFRVSNSAIREVEGQKGVYVLSGNIVKFKKINILHSDSEYSICNNPDNASGFLERYDEIIVEGTDLYDGKIIGK